MSENQAPTTEAPVAEVPATPTPKVITSVTRNDVSITFVETPYKRQKEGEPKETYPFPDNFAQFPFADKVKFIGQDNVNSIIDAKFALYCQNWAYEAFPREVAKEGPNKGKEVITGPMDINDFVKYVQGFSARGETLAELQERSNELAISLPGIKDPVELMKRINELSVIATTINAKKKKD